MILLGFGVYRGVIAFLNILLLGFSLIDLIFGGIGIIGVILAYYKSTSSAKRYLLIGMFYGLIAIVLIFRLTIVELITGLLIFLSGV